jgi:hypothetical protein
VDKQASVELTSWSRFDTPNLEIEPALLGQSHVFTFDGHRIEISLPSVDRLAGFKDAEDGTFMDERISVPGWRMHDGQRQPLAVEVYDVDVVVSIPGRPSLPQEARTTPITHEFFSEEQMKHLDKLATDYGDLAYRAFDLWIRTLRWKADSYRIGLPESGGVGSSESRIEIREKDTLYRFWTNPLYINAYIPAPVKVEVWDKVAAALSTGDSPPIFYDLLYSAMAHLERGDLRLTIIVDTAVAAETYMKLSVQAGLPNDLDDPLKEYINNAQIWRVRDKFFPKRLDTQQRKVYKSLRPDLKKLFDDRNDIMHSGQKEGLTASYCQKIIRSVRELVTFEPRKAA